MMKRKDSLKNAGLLFVLLHFLGSVKVTIAYLCIMYQNCSNCDSSSTEGKIVFFREFLFITSKLYFLFIAGWQMYHYAV